MAVGLAVTGRVDRGQGLLSSASKAGWVGKPLPEMGEMGATVTARFWVSGGRAVLVGTDWGQGRSLAFQARRAGWGTPCCWMMSHTGAEDIGG